MNRRDLDNADFVRTRVQPHLGVTVDGHAGGETRAAWDARHGAPVAPTAPSGSPRWVDRSLRLPEAQYRQKPRTAPDLLVLHHTAGGSAESTFNHWATTPERIGTAILLERSGNPYEVFDPATGWAYHLGVRGLSAADRDALERRALGIELCSEGGLTERAGRLYAFGAVSERTEYKGEVYDHGSPWRGFRHFAAYDPRALAALYELVDGYLEEYAIPRRTPRDHLAHNHRLLGFRGVVGHHHMRPDKSDVHPGFPWRELVERCRLELVDP